MVGVITDGVNTRTSIEDVNNMTEYQRGLILRFKGPEQGFQAPGGGASYEVHEEWRTTELAALRELETEGILRLRSEKPCSSHGKGKCDGQPIGVIAVLTEDGQRTREELVGG
jgi:hypothetical protein